MKCTLKNRIVLAAVIISILWGGLFFYVSERHIYQEKKKALESLLLSLSAGFEPTILYNIDSDPEAIKTIMASALRRVEQIKIIEVFNSQGRLIVHKDSADDRETPKPDNLGDPSYSKHGLVFTDRDYRFYYPLRSGDSDDSTPRKGTIVMYGSKEFFLTEVERDRSFYRLVSLISGLLLIVFSTCIAYYVSKPIVYLSEATKRVSEGDASSSIDNRYDGEIGELINNFNLMIGRLNAAHTELKSYTVNLEKIIELRTMRLNKAVDEISRQKDFFDTIISTVGALIVVYDEAGRIVMFNRTSEQVLDYSESEVKGNYTWDFFVLPEHKAAAIDLFNEIIYTKAPVTHENIWVSKDGKEKNILWHFTTVQEHGHVRYIISTGIDITEKKRLEQYLMESQRFQSISTMLSGLSHNFNNILVGIMGYAGLVRIRLSALEQTAEIEEINKYLDTIESASQKASDLIRHIRSFSKRTEYHKDIINLNDSALSVYTIISMIFPNTIKVEIELDERLWAVRADKGSIEQALMNICINAKEAMSAGGTLRIETSRCELGANEIASLNAGKYVRITLSDTGHGMDSNILERIFEPFFTTRSMLDHMGLGLTQAYSIISDHAGHISVESMPDKGSVFRIYLPAVLDAGQ